MGPHIPGRARRVGEARVCLQPLLCRWRDAAEDDAQSPEAHVDRLADRDARQALNLRFAKQLKWKDFQGFERILLDFNGIVRHVDRFFGT